MRGLVVQGHTGMGAALSSSSSLQVCLWLLAASAFNVVRGQSADGDVSCIAKHASNWGDKMGELRIDVSSCDKGYIEWVWPKGHLQVIFEDDWRPDFLVCIEQMDLSPWTAIRNMTHYIDNRIEPLKLPIGSPTCASATDGRLRICIEKPLLRVYRTSLYFDINRR